MRYGRATLGVCVMKKEFLTHPFDFEFDPSFNAEGADLLEDPFLDVASMDDRTIEKPGDIFRSMGRNARANLSAPSSIVNKTNASVADTNRENTDSRPFRHGKLNWRLNDY